MALAKGQRLFFGQKNRGQSPKTRTKKNRALTATGKPTPTGARRIPAARLRCGVGCESAGPTKAWPWHGWCELGRRPHIGEVPMKRRQFITSGAALAGLGLPILSRAQAQPEVIQVGHLVGICMS